MLGRLEDALRLRHDIYSRKMRLNGEEYESTIIEASNYALTFNKLKRFAEAKKVLRKALPVARRVLGDCDETTLRMRLNYAEALYKADGATLDDIREAVTTLEETDRISRRVLGGAHPATASIERDLLRARATLRARERPGSS